MDITVVCHWLTGLLVHSRPEHALREGCFAALLSMQNNSTINRNGTGKRIQAGLACRRVMQYPLSMQCPNALCVVRVHATRRMSRTMYE